MKRTGIVCVYSSWSDFENIVTILKTQYVTICPVSQSTIFWKTIPANSRTRENNVTVSRPHFYCIDNFNEINPVTFCKYAPFIKKCKYGCPVGIFYYLQIGRASCRERV